MRGRRGRAIAICVAGAVAVAACGGDDRSVAGSTGQPSVGSSAAQVPPGSTPPPTVATSPPGPPPAPAAGSFTIVAGGDVLLHEPTWAQADADLGTSDDDSYDFGPQLSPIEPVVAAADLALCHLETPLAADGGPYSGYPSFSGPPQIASGLAATGFDACSLASNHTWDKGLAGVERTVTTLQAAGITPYGAAVAGQPGNPTTIEVGGVRVGLLSYTYGHNAAPGNGAVEVVDVDDAVADAAAARAAGADLVVASIHWGTEYDHEINAQQRDLAPALLASPDIDLVIGHHAHVVQPIARIGTEWVAYGLGNMLAAHATELPANREGALARFTFTETPNGWMVAEAAYLPIMVDVGPPLRMVDLPVALAGDVPADRRDRYETALNRTRDVVHRLDGGAALVEIAPNG